MVVLQIRIFKMIIVSVLTVVHLDFSTTLFFQIKCFYSWKEQCMPGISGTNLSAWQGFGLTLNMQKCQSNVNCRPAILTQ